jgi:hypothetical protein
MCMEYSVLSAHGKHTRVPTRTPQPGSAERVLAVERGHQPGRLRQGALRRQGPSGASTVLRVPRRADPRRDGVGPHLPHAGVRGAGRVPAPQVRQPGTPAARRPGREQGKTCSQWAGAKRIDPLSQRARVHPREHRVLTWLPGVSCVPQRIEAQIPATSVGAAANEKER